MNPLSMAELGILDWIAAHCHNSFWDAVMPFITGLGDQGILWILLGVLILIIFSEQVCYRHIKVISYFFQYGWPWHRSSFPLSY